MAEENETYENGCCCCNEVGIVSDCQPDVLLFDEFADSYVSELIESAKQEILEDVQAALDNLPIEVTEQEIDSIFA